MGRYAKIHVHSGKALVCLSSKVLQWNILSIRNVFRGQSSRIATISFQSVTESNRQTNVVHLLIFGLGVFWMQLLSIYSLIMGHASVRLLRIEFFLAVLGRHNFACRIELQTLAKKDMKLPNRTYVNVFNLLSCINSVCSSFTANWKKIMAFNFAAIA